MATLSSEIVQSLAAAGFAAMGIGALVKPGLVMAQFGMPPPGAPARSEVRAVYGGFGLAMASLLVAGFFLPPARSGISLTIGVALLGMAAGRVVSAIVDRTIGRTPLLYLALEAVIGSLLLWVA
jgi:hypothetical protein